jgi:hypothetical protein
VPDAEGEGGGRSRACMSASGCQAGFHETFRGDFPKGSFGAGRCAEPAKAAGIAPRPEPAGRRRRLNARAATRNGAGRKGLRLRDRLRESGEAFGRSRDPKRGFERFRPREAPRKAGRLQGPPSKLRLRWHPRPSDFRKGDRRGFGLDASPRRRRGFGRAGSAREAMARISVLPKRPDGNRRGAPGPLGETHRVPNGASRPRSGIRGKRSGRSRPPRNPKPPSERWPRHPATAVKAGTSGGRWRHRPPL